MRTLTLLAALALGFVDSTPAQITTLPVRYVTSNPTGACVYNYISINQSTKLMRVCNSGTWADFAGGAGVTYCPDASGSGTTYTCTGTPTLSAYSAGVTIAFVPQTSSTGGATTLNVDAVGVRSIKLADGSTNPTSSTFQAGYLYMLVDDGTRLRVSTTQPGVCDYGTLGATPAFNAALCGAVAGSYTTFTNDSTHQLAGNATVTFSNFVVGATYKFIIYQGTGTAYTVTWPASVLGPCIQDPTLNTYTVMTGTWDGTSLYVNGNCTTSDTQFVLRGPTRTAPSVTTITSGIACWYDSTTLSLQCEDTNAQQYGMPLMTTYASTGTALLTPTANPVAFPLLCSASPGTTINGLVKIDTAGKAYTPATAADNIGAVGIATATCTSGSVLVVTQGIIRVNFDATAVVKGDYVLGSTATAGKVTSSGASQPANGIQIIGRVVDESGAGTNTYKVNVNISSVNPNPGTSANCSSSASPAVCGAAAGGTVVVAAAATTVVVNTTAVTANSLIFLMYDSSLGTKLGVTCNTTEPALYGVTARTAATSFTITATAPVTNPACLSYLVVN